MKVKKKHIYIGILIILLIVLIVILTNKSEYLFANSEDSNRFREEYESLNNEMSVDNKAYPKVNIDSNNIKYLTIDETLDILENGTAAIYIGYAECIYCRNAVQVLVDTAKEMELENIYYLDISEIWDIKELNENNEVITTKEADERYKKLLEELGDDYYLENYILTNEKDEQINAGTKRVKVPLVIFVVNGNIVSSNVGTLFSQEDPYIALDEDQIIGLKEIYQYGIKDVLDGLKAETN